MHFAFLKTVYPQKGKDVILDSIMYNDNEVDEDSDKTETISKYSRLK